jgi:DNA-binding SARP family transcriptional activator
MSTLEIRTLGAFGVRWAGVPVSSDFWDGRRASLIFQTLVAAPEFRVAQDILADRFWPASTFENSRMNLGGRIAELRAVFKGLAGRPADDFPITVGNGFVAIDPAIDLSIDARVLEQQLRAALETGPASAEFAERALEALAAWTGEYLPALERDEVLVVRRRIARSRVALANRLLRTSGDDARVRAAALQVFHQQSQDEALAAALIDANLSAGERDRALEAFERHAGALTASGFQPAATLRLRVAPFQRGSIRAEPASAHSSLVGREAELRELGEMLDSALLGHSMALELYGRRGVGRSRLLAALVDRARMRGVSVGVARGTLTDTSDVVLHDLVRSLTEQIGASERKRKRLVPPDSIVRFGDVDAAVGALVSAARWAAAGSPLLLALDDADFVAREAIEDITGALADDPAFPVSFLLVRRAGCEPLLPDARQFAVPALSESVAAQLLADRFGSDLDPQILDDIRALWPGSLTRQRALAVAPDARIAVPASLRIDVEARYASLTPEARTFLDGSGEADLDVEADLEVIEECDRAGLLGEREGEPVVPPVVRRILGI